MATALRRHPFTAACSSIVAVTAAITAAVSARWPPYCPTWLHTVCSPHLNPGVHLASWPSNGLAGLAARRQPARVRANDGRLPSTQWRAMTRWHSTAYLESSFRPLQAVWQREVAGSEVHERPEDEQRAFVYFAEGGEHGSVFGMRAPPSSSRLRRVQKHDVMHMADFIAAADRGELLYCSLSAVSLGAAAEADLRPLAAFNLATQHNASDATDQPTEAIVWLGAGRAVTHAHYDTSHNAFIQVVGRKRFTLWPPSALRGELALYPTRHSLHRQSSLDAPRLQVASTARQTLTPHP